MKDIVTTITSFEGLATAFRDGNACIQITRLTGGIAKVPKSYFGVLLIQGVQAQIRLRSVDPKEQGAFFRILQPGVKIQGSGQTFTGLLDGHLPVKFMGVRDKTSDFNSDSGSHYIFTFNQIESKDCSAKRRKSGEIFIKVMIADSKLYFKNTRVSRSATCDVEGDLNKSRMRESLCGQLDQYRFRISQVEDDIEIIINLRQGMTSMSAKHDERFKSALILVFQWLNGGQPYPYYQFHKRDDQTLYATIQPLRTEQNSRPRVLERVEHNTHFSEILELGITYFKKQGSKQDELRLFFWQYRDATREGLITYSMLLQACSLLEGIVGYILKNSLCLSKSQIEKLRLPGEKRANTAGSRFYAATVYLGFDWITEFEPVFKVWKAVRNALAHGDLMGFQKNMPGSFLKSYGRVTQAYNALILREIGYTGEISLDEEWFAVKYFQ